MSLRLRTLLTAIGILGLVLMGVTLSALDKSNVAQAEGRGD
jgi:hypothetical protein